MLKSYDPLDIERLMMEETASLPLGFLPRNRKERKSKERSTRRKPTESTKTTKKINPITPINEAQKELLEMISENDVSIVVGPAGTGKTAVSVRYGLEQVLKNKYRKIVITRPVVSFENEDIGFLPGNLNEKFGVWVRPLIDAMADTVGSKVEVQKLIDSGIIEMIPLAFTQGLTYNNTFVVADEFQNATINQFKMLVSRIGLGSKMIFTGDLAQSALKEKENGLNYGVRLLEEHEIDDGLFFFDVNDVIRSDAAKRWISVFEKECQ